MFGDLNEAGRAVTDTLTLVNQRLAALPPQKIEAVVDDVAATIKAIRFVAETVAEIVGKRNL